MPNWFFNSCSSPRERPDEARGRLVLMTSRGTESAYALATGVATLVTPGPVMVVKDAEGREHWELATPEYLRKVEVDNGLILVDWPVELE